MKYLNILNEIISINLTFLLNTPLFLLYAKICSIFAPRPSEQCPLKVKPLSHWLNRMTELD